MIQAIKFIPKKSWDGATTGTITLTSQDRHRRRRALRSDEGREFILKLEQTTFLQEGDVLLLDDETSIRVKAAREELLQITARDSVGLLVLAWHIGNRHLQAQIEKDRILIFPDHVIEKMVIGLGASTANVIEPFHPESGAYDTHAPH